jgi:ribosomal protein S6--L-glutamate ligase
MIVSFHPCITADRQVILGSRPPGSGDGLLAARAEAVLLPQTCPERLYRLCRDGGARCFPRYDLRFSDPGKSGQARLFRERGLPHPETRIWDSLGALERAARSGSLPHESPFLLKTDADHEGRGVFRVERAAGLETALSDLKRRGREAEPVLTQELVPNGGNVLRAVILGHAVRTYWKRSTEGGGVTVTVSRGARIDASWREDLQERGKALAREIHRDLGIDLAAVDMVFDMERGDPNPRVLEINYAFGRRGLGGSEAYYRLLFAAVCEWLEENGLDSSCVGVV